MPFGCTPDAAGAQFRLWAPAATSVELELTNAGVRRVAPMRQAADGWFERRVEAARPGARYRYRIDGKIEVPDPASRHQPEDVHGPSEIIDSHAYRWSDGAWRGLPWHEIVFYELHVGAFTREGSFEAAARRLPYLRDLGVTAVELMPLADFPGARNWGYDGVLPYAPDSRYGRPDDLKRLIDVAHGLGLAVFLDVVYNHFGPDGNYLYVYARDRFFTQRHQTPWGAAINFDGLHSRVVRDFYLHNALYWLEEFHFDGLRLDAVHAICDDSDLHILTELAAAVRRGPGRERHVHLVLENDDNAARFLAPAADRAARGYDAQWNDDAHHSFHVLLTGERDGYYADYADAPERRLARTLAEGFAYQGEFSPFRGRPRGEPSRDLHPSAFVVFLQNHDQIGNRACGERLSVLARPEALRAAYSIMLLAPSIPLLFMGEEYGCTQPFPFFCDFKGELAAAVTNGRRREFACFARFHGANPDSIPDPNAAATFEMTVLDWNALREPGHASWHAFVRALLEVRRREIVPRLPQLVPGGGAWEILAPGALRVQWRLGGDGWLSVIANLSEEMRQLDAPIRGEPIYRTPGAGSSGVGMLPPWSVAWSLEMPDQQ